VNMSRIRTTDPYEHGKFRATGILGRIEFDKDGYFDVPKEKEDGARKLCTISETLTFIEDEEPLKKVTPKGKQKELPEPEPIADLPLKSSKEGSDPIEDEKKIAAGEPTVTEEKIEESEDEKE